MFLLLRNIASKYVVVCDGWPITRLRVAYVLLADVLT